MTNIINIILSFGERIGYWGIVLLMAIESSFLPLPSEVIIPPAAYLAEQGRMNIFLVIIFGALGSVLGASFNYLIGRLIGQTLIYKLADHRLAKIFFINSQKLKKAEIYFLKSANLSTFVGRLIPGIRHLISIPAGFFRMDFKQFILYTFSGSLLWCSILAFLGYAFGSNKQMLEKYYKEISLFLLVSGLIFLAALYLKKRNNKN
jgi:membrane protein DedA with SNARE-associated domain